MLIMSELFIRLNKVFQSISYPSSKFRHVEPISSFPQVELRSKVEIETLPKYEQINPRQ